MKRSLWVGFAGNLLEHYDTALFGLLAPFLAPLFFPSESGALSLILTYALLPIGFISKPAGALVLGWLGDRFGRRKALSISLFGMAATTGIVGFLPTYEQIGIWAPVLLAASRMVQGFFTAAETAGGAIFVLDQVPESKRCLASSFYDASGILGILLGSAIAAVWGGDGWRWMFWAGALTGIMGAILRWDRTPELQSPARTPFWILWQERSSLAAIALVAGFSYYNYYLITMFMNGFLPLVSPLSKKEAMELNTLLLCLDLLLLPVFGWIANKISKEKLMLGASGAITLLAIPLFQLLEGAGIATAIFVRLTLMVLGIALAAPFFAWAYERTPSQHRFLIVAVGTAIGSRLIGAPAPAMGLWLYHMSGWAPGAALPLVLLGISTCGIFLLQPRKKLEALMDKEV